MTQRVIESARSHGRTLKLVAEIDLTNRPALTSVKMTALPLDHPLAGVSGVGNGILVETTGGDELFLSGPGGRWRRDRRRGDRRSRTGGEGEGTDT